jgi:hypothetical protein
VFQFFFTEFLKSTDAAWRTEASTRTSLLATIWRTCSAWPGICWSATSWLSARIIMYYTVIELYESEYGRLRLVLKLPRTVLQTRHSLELTKTPSLCMWKQSLRNFGTDLIERRLRNWCFVFVIIYPKKKSLLWLLVADFCSLFFLFTVYCFILCTDWFCVSLDTVCYLILCTAWYECCWFFLPGRLLHFLLYCIVYYWMFCLMLTDADCSQITTGHSALRTMWLSAPVLAYVPVDIWHWMYAPPQPLNARVGVWHRSGWLIHEESQYL